MAKKKKIRIDRLIIVILSTLLALGVLFFGVYYLIDTLSSRSKDDKHTNDPVVVTTDGVKVTLNDYTIYSDDTGDIGFDFIIAELNFEANEPVSFEFKNLQTSEKVALNDISSSINKLELAGYDISKLNISVDGVKSNENKASAKVLIPYNTDSYSLSIYNSIDASKIEFDLTKKAIPATTLKLSNNNTEIEVGSTKVSVTNAYISDFMLHNGEKFEISSSDRVYSFEITVLEAQDNVSIVDATFIEKGTDEEVKCMKQEYKAIDMDNILGKNLTVGTKAGLFFKVYSNEDVVNDGTLLIKFSNSDKLVEISTSNN